ENPLRVDIMVDCLQLLQKIGGGLSHAFVKLVATDLNLTNMTLISNYVHLRFVDLSMNKIKDTTPLRALLFLTTLKMDANLIQMLQLQPFLYLQQASFSNNFIHLTIGFFHPSITHFNLGFNRLRSMAGCKLSLATNLTELQLNGNKLTSLVGINCPNLKRLYAANNRLRSFEGVETLVNLDILHLRKNKFRSIDERVVALKNLTYFNLRFSDWLWLAGRLYMAGWLVVIGCPIEKMENYRQEVLMIIPTLKKLDKEIFLEIDYQEALDVKVEREEEMRMKVRRR
ncbi:hypothetical protein HELRODRAFT_83919, partial [Helobdella robusta]|uniref:Dynein assembly factor 1, axonemal homolog n=1 Tax=Helobdella robusta TaxID=6412 RepID=T1G5B9_HELRO